MSEFKHITVNEYSNVDGNLELEKVYQLKRIADELAKKNNGGAI